MFITSFGEQNITYKCCSNFLIHLYFTDIKVVEFGEKVIEHHEKTQNEQQTFAPQGKT